MSSLPVIKEATDVCKGCMLRKQHRKSFLSSQAWRAKEILELILADVSRPMKTPSFENSKYFILFIDDYIRMTWVYFMRENLKYLRFSRNSKGLLKNKVDIISK